MIILMMKMMMVQVTQRSVSEDAPLGHIVPMVSAFVIQVIIMRMMMRMRRRMMMAMMMMRMTMRRRRRRNICIVMIVLLVEKASFPL